MAGTTRAEAQLRSGTLDILVLLLSLALLLLLLLLLVLLLLAVAGSLWGGEFADSLHAFLVGQAVRSAAILVLVFLVTKSLVDLALVKEALVDLPNDRLVSGKRSTLEWDVSNRRTNFRAAAIIILTDGGDFYEGNKDMVDRDATKVKLVKDPAVGDTRGFIRRDAEGDFDTAYGGGSWRILSG